MTAALAWGEHHDPVTSRVGTAAGSGEFGTGDGPVVDPGLAGGAVERGHVYAAPRQEDGLLPFGNVGVPATDSCPDGVASGRVQLDAVVRPIPGDGLLGIARSKLVERPALGGVVLADVLVEDVDSVRVLVEQRLEPAGSDGPELAVVADHQCLGASLLDRVEDAEQRA